MRKGVEHIFLSKYMKDKYQELWHPMGNCWVVTNHQIAALRTKSQIDGNNLKEGIKLCFAGRMSQEKGFWDCESVTRLLLTENLGIKAVFLGPVFDAEILEAIENLKQDFPLRFDHIGHYDETMLTRSLQDSSYFLFPSRYSNEASPLVVLEAQAIGNICITSNVGTLSTDVLSPGLAVDIKIWHKTVLEIVQQKRFNNLNLKLATDRIREKSNILALACDKQMKEVFRL
jgi:glycosyltransferase involved in cell wall biosynthesis